MRRPALAREERADLRALRTWRCAADRPRALLGLVPLGRVVVAPFLVASAVYAPGTGRASLFVECVLVGQLVLDPRGVLHPRRALERWLASTYAPPGALLALRRELEHRLVRELRRKVWRPVNEELDARERVAPLHDVRPGAAEEAAS